MRYIVWCIKSWSILVLTVRYGLGIGGIEDVNNAAFRRVLNALFLEDFVHTFCRNGVTNGIIQLIIQTFW